MEITYLDNNATTQPAPEVVDAMIPFLREWWGNPSSIHRFGQHARQAVDRARGQVARLVGANENEIIFTGGGTEACNFLVRGVLAGRGARKQVITSTVEHSATRELCRALAAEGFDVAYVNVNRGGELNMAEFAQALSDQTAAVTLMWANNETGVIFPIEQVARMCKEKGVPFHCDGTQAIGKIPVDVKAAGVDAMTFAAHKFHGPKGVGAAYARRGLRVRPMVLGGPQELGRRGGTENVPSIVGMGVASELAAAHLADIDDVRALRDRLESGILESVEDSAVNGRVDLRVPNTTNISFARLEADAIIILLSEKGVCASAGAACSSGSLEPSPIITAMGIERKMAHGAVRFSLSRFTTPEEVQRALAIVPGVIDKLRGVLPVGV